MLPSRSLLWQGGGQILQVLNREPRLWGLERSQEGIVAQWSSLSNLTQHCHTQEFLRGEELPLPCCRYLGGICQLRKGA